MTPDSKQIISASKDRSLIFWDLNSFKKIDSISLKDKYIKKLAISSDSKNLFGGDSEGKITKWDTNSRNKLPFSFTNSAFLLKNPLMYHCKECWVTSENKEIVILDFNNTLLVWDLKSKRKSLTLKIDDLTAYCFIDNKKSFIFSTRSPISIKELVFSSGEIIERFHYEQNAQADEYIIFLKASFDNSVILSNDSAHKFKFWKNKDRPITISLETK